MEKKPKNLISIREKSVLSPSTQTIIPCAVRIVDNQLMLVAQSIIDDNTKYPAEMRCILEMQLNHGLRISEVLGIEPSDLLSRSMVRIKTAKKGKTRIISFADATGFLKLKVSTKSKPFVTYDRFAVYRFYKQNGLALYIANNRKYAVTHLFRHLFASSVFNSTNDKNLAAESIGHKGKTSIDFYINK